MVVKNSTVPVIETGAGVCHTYVDFSANVDMAVGLVFFFKIFFLGKRAGPPAKKGGEVLIVK